MKLKDIAPWKKSYDKHRHCIKKQKHHFADKGPYLVSSVAQSCLTLSDHTDCSTPGLRVHHHLPEFTQTHVHSVGDAIQPSHHLSSPSPPAFNLSLHQGLFHWVDDAIQTSHLLPSSSPFVFSLSYHQGLFQWVGSLHQVAKVLDFSFSINSSKVYPGLISFKINWFDLAIQGALKSLLHHHSLKPSILWCSAFFMVLLSHSYMTTGKIIALTRWTFVSKVISLFFNMLSRLIIALFQRASVFPYTQSYSFPVVCMDMRVGP